jgi:predicted 2-oxoglutarate/Fe(II)-dependent dioxygenase YbiX/peroxiredoxin
MARITLRPGDPAPWFVAPCSANPRYVFSSVGGRYVVLCFLGSASRPEAQQALALIAEHRALFDDHRACLFGVSVDPADREEGRLVQSLPGIRHFWDTDAAISRAYGMVEEAEGAAPLYHPRWIVLDPMLRVIASLPLAEGEQALAFLAALPPPGLHGGAEATAPVLVLPRVFEPEFCRHLIGLYEAGGGEPSGFMREVDGRTVAVFDPGHKVRADFTIEDEAVRAAARGRMVRRLVPEIQKAFQFRATRMERYIVACYDAADGGHFAAHRDNTTKGTAHRRFAVTINLNAEEFEGGELRFPEFGPRAWRAPTGGAVVFSCSLLHQAMPVTRGRRYAFLPFLYDDEAARIREQNIGFVGDGSHAYRSGVG